MSGDTGGPAFPQPINPGEQGRGMRLRDYFAAKAPIMLEEAAHLLDPYVSLNDQLHDRRELLFAKHAQMSHEWADAMLKERSK